MSAGCGGSTGVRNGIVAGEARSRRLRGVMAMFEGHNHRTVTQVVQGLAALAACHRVRVASPEVIQRLGWRNLGGAWIHTLRRGGSQGFAGQATRGTTISARCHGCVVRGMCIVSANAWDTPRYSRTAAPGRVGRDYMYMSDEITCTCHVGGARPIGPISETCRTRRCVVREPQGASRTQYRAIPRDRIEQRVRRGLPTSTVTKRSPEGQVRSPSVANDHSLHIHI